MIEYEFYQKSWNQCIASRINIGITLLRVNNYMRTYLYHNLFMATLKVAPIKKRKKTIRRSSKEFQGSGCKDTCNASIYAIFFLSHVIFVFYRSLIRRGVTWSIEQTKNIEIGQQSERIACRIGTSYSNIIILLLFYTLIWYLYKYRIFTITKEKYSCRKMDIKNHRKSGYFRTSNIVVG